MYFIGLELTFVTEQRPHTGLQLYDNNHPLILGHPIDPFWKPAQAFNINIVIHFSPSLISALHQSHWPESVGLQAPLTSARCL
jgi:hypothetical protein